MATDFDVQGRGYGALVLRFAEAHLAELGVEQVWANARDTALGFYVATGWTIVEGSEHLSPETNLPHTVIVKTFSHLGAFRHVVTRLLVLIDAKVPNPPHPPGRRGRRGRADSRARQQDQGRRTDDHHDDDVETTDGSLDGAARPHRRFADAARADRQD